MIPEKDTCDYAFTTFEFWHKALCHSAPSTMLNTERLIQNSNIIPKMPVDFSCEACIVSKSTHKTPKPSRTRAKLRGEYIHSDLCGPFATPSYGNALYYICFVDDTTRYSCVQILKCKSDAANATVEFINRLETQYDFRVKSFRTDNGGEYVNSTLSKYFAKKGISHHLTPPYSPESNGVAERLNHSIGEGIRAMLLPFKDKRLWAEAVKTFIYTKDRLSHRSVDGKTPFEAFHGTKPSINHLQPFGRECYVHIPIASRPSGSKLLPKAMKGIFVGYTEVNHQYRIFVQEKRKLYISADVTFPAVKLTTEKTNNFPNVMNAPIHSSVSQETSSISFTNEHEHQIQNLLHQDPSHTSHPESQQSSSTSTRMSIDSEPIASPIPQDAQAHTQEIMSVNSRPKRTIRPRTFDDTITGDWWNTSRDPPQPNSSISTSVNDQEFAMANIPDELEPKTYNCAKVSQLGEMGCSI